MFKQRPPKFDEQLPALAHDESGQALAEYALVLALVSLTALGLTPVGQWLSMKLTDIASAI